MDSDEAIYAANQIIRVVNGELDDAERALKAGSPDKAGRELNEAMSKLKRIASRLRAAT